MQVGVARVGVDEVLVLVAVRPADIPARRDEESDGRLEDVRPEEVVPAEKGTGVAVKRIDVEPGERGFGERGKPVRLEIEFGQVFIDRL